MLNIVKDLNIVADESRVLFIKNILPVRTIDLNMAFIKLGLVCFDITMVLIFMV